MGGIHWPDWLLQAGTYAQQHQDGIRNTFATLAAIASILYYGLTRLRTGSARLFSSVRRRYAFELSADGHDLYWRLRREHSDEPVGVSSVYIGNSGRQALRREDFDGEDAFELHASDLLRFRWVEVGETVPADLADTVQLSGPDERTIRMRPLLLNGGDVIELRVVHVGRTWKQDLRQLTTSGWHWFLVGIVAWPLQRSIIDLSGREDFAVRVRALNIRRVFRYGALRRGLALLPASLNGRILASIFGLTARLLALVSILFLGAVVLREFAPTLGDRFPFLPSAPQLLSYLAEAFGGALALVGWMVGFVYGLDLIWDQGIARWRKARKDERAHRS